MHMYYAETSWEATKCLDWEEDSMEMCEKYLSEEVCRGRVDGRISKVLTPLERTSVAWKRRHDADLQIFYMSGSFVQQKLWYITVV